MDFGSALDTASSLLGGPKGGAAAAAPDAKVTWYKGDNLGIPDPTEGGAHAPEDLRVHDGGVAIEFIHFGHVFPDSSLNFSHADRKDDELLDLENGAKSRAIMFRAALEREAILVSGFMTGCQKALKEYEDSKGGLGDAIGMVSDFVGGGGGSSAGPKASDVDAHGAKIKAAGAVINVAAVQYKDIHQAGIDLYQNYRNFEAFRNGMIDNPPGSGGGPGLLGQVSAIAGALPGIGNVVKIIQGIAFKMFDVYVAIYLRIGKEQEQKICNACREITVNAIQTKFSPVYNVWHPPPDAPPDPNANSGSSSGTGVGFIDDAKKTVDDAKKTVDKTKQDIKDFFEGTGKDAPGAAFVDLAFGIAPPPAPKDGDPKPQIKPPKEIAELVVSAFKKAIDVDSLPDFLLTIIKEIVEIDGEFLRAMYKKLCEMDPKDPIVEEELLVAARKRLLQKLVDLLISQISILQKVKDFSVGVQGMNVSPGRALDAGEDELNKDLGEKLDPVLKIFVSQCVDALEGVRQQADGNKAMTMEAYLGLFPYILALNFRNTFFPVWDLLVDNTFGKMGPLSSVVNSAKGAMKDAQSKVDMVREEKMRAEKVYDRAKKDGLQVGSGGQNLTEYQKDMDSKLDRGPDTPPKPAVIPFFPVEGRLNNANGVEITKSEYDEVFAKEKWDLATNEPA
jgi:hypothetical protein